jgi:putative endonuclease
MRAPFHPFALSRRSRRRGTFVRAMDRRELGQIGETLAASYLTTRGWNIVDRNVRYREGEIDIVAARGGILAFVEVKTRRSAAFGSPAEAVTWKKQRRIRALASRYLAERHPGAHAIRFDVVDIARDHGGFLVTHLEDAF